MSDEVYYAIGDVHGEAEKLTELIGHIGDDFARLGVAPKLVFLGDLIDRGADSRGVVARVMALQRESGAIVIKGNHEELMLHAFDREDTIGLYHWANNGGDETIASYEAVNGDKDHWRESIDPAHVAWLRTLPTIVTDEASADRVRARRHRSAPLSELPRRFAHVDARVVVLQVAHLAGARGTRGPAGGARAYPDRR